MIFRVLMPSLYWPLHHIFVRGDTHALKSSCWNSLKFGMWCWRTSSSGRSRIDFSPISTATLIDSRRWPEYHGTSVWKWFATHFDQIHLYLLEWLHLDDARHRRRAWTLSPLRPIENQNYQNFRSPPLLSLLFQMQIGLSCALLQYHLRLCHESNSRGLGASAPSKLLPCPEVAAYGGDNERHEECCTSGTTLSIKITHLIFLHVAKVACTVITIFCPHIRHNSPSFIVCEHLVDPFLWAYVSDDRLDCTFAHPWAKTQTDSLSVRGCFST